MVGIFSLYQLSDCAGNLTGTQTAGTNIDMAGRTINDRLNALDIGLPRTVGTTVRVGNSDTESHTLVAKLALCHPLHLLAVVKIKLAHSQAVDTITDTKAKCKSKFQKSSNFLFFSRIEKKRGKIRMVVLVKRGK